MTEFRKLKFFILYFFFFTSMIMFSQETQNKWRFNFQLDNRFSSLRNNNITIFGAKAGLQYKKLTRIGLGGSFILNPVTISYINKKTKLTEENNINFWYFSIFNDWILLKNDKWEVFLTEQIGFGKPSFTREVNNEIVTDINVKLYVNEVSAQANYKIFKWLGVGGGIGYRNLWNNKSVLTSTFNAPIYIGKIIIYPESFLELIK